MQRVCVVIVHHQGKELLHACLQNVLSSRGVQVEVVVVANACMEDLPEIVEQHDSVWCASSSAPLGFSGGNNFGVASTTDRAWAPDFYFFLNNDAMVEADTLRRLVETADRDNGIGVVGPRLMILGCSNVLNSLGLNVTVTGEAWDEGIGQTLPEYGTLPDAREVFAVTGAALMIRSGLFHEIGGWEELYEYYFEDIDLCMRARRRGWKVVLDPEAVVWHAISATAARGSDFKLLLSWRNRLILVAVHWPMGLLMRAAPVMIWRELQTLGARIMHRAYQDARLQLRSWVGFLRVAGDVLRLRTWRQKETSWVELMRPGGSVPVIVLPELPDKSDLVAGAGAMTNE